MADKIEPVALDAKEVIDITNKKFKVLKTPVEGSLTMVKAKDFQGYDNFHMIAEKDGKAGLYFVNNGTFNCEGTIKVVEGATIKIMKV